jgi:hypothetical protein
VTNSRKWNLLRHSTTINDSKKILRCPCCRQINWKHLHNEIVNNMYLDIENKYKRRIATLAEHVFYRNWCSIEKDEDSEDEDSEDEDSEDEDSDDEDSEEGDITSKEIKIKDIVKLKTEKGKIIRVVVIEILQNEYIGAVLSFCSEYEFYDTLSFTKDDIVFTKDKVA